jgi:hypothetical protein
VGDEELNCFDVWFQLFGEGQTESNQSSRPLAQRAEETLNVVGMPFLLTELVLLWGNHLFVGIPIVRIDLGLVAIILGNGCTAVPHLKSHHLTAMTIKGYPDPLFIGFVSYKAPPLIGFTF